MKGIKCLIIGSGPAGYTAAIYASRANLSPVLVTGMQPGGQLTTTTEVENFPGYPEGVTGTQLMVDLEEQAKRFGTDVRFGNVTATDLKGKVKKVTLDESEVLEADTLIIATGASAKYLGLEDEQKYSGSGVSACATCDGFFYKGKDVAVVGGGDTACEEALYLAALCNKVYLIVRRDELRASKVMQKRVQEAENVEVLWKHQLACLEGEQVVERAVLDKNRGEANQEKVVITIDGLFLAIGHHPNSEVFAELEKDKEGYIRTQAGTSSTNIAGVFAAGDVQDSRYRQAVTAAGSGCMAAIDAEKYLSEQK